MGFCCTSPVAGASAISDQGSAEPFAKWPLVMNSSIGHVDAEEVGGELDVGLEVKLAETLLADRSEDVTEESEAPGGVVESDVGFTTVEVAEEEVLIRPEEVLEEPDNDDVAVCDGLRIPGGVHSDPYEIVEVSCAVVGYT